MTKPSRDYELIQTVLRVCPFYKSEQDLKKQLEDLASRLKNGYIVTAEEAFVAKFAALGGTVNGGEG